MTRHDWEKAGYRPNMASAVAANPPDDRSYLRVYHLTTSTYAISNIALGRIKLSRFSELNDPFELLGVSFREKKNRKPVQEYKADFDSKYGLLCFSEDWAEPLLWSHYGEKHRGICLGLNVLRSKLEKVDYSSHRITDYLDNVESPDGLPTDLQEALRRTKYSGWKYEEEQRMFFPIDQSLQEAGSCFVEFNNEIQLAEVILGAQSALSLDSFSKMVHVRYPNVTVFKSRLEYKGFHVVPENS